MFLADVYTRHAVVFSPRSTTHILWEEAPLFFTGIKCWAFSYLTPHLPYTSPSFSLWFVSTLQRFLPCVGEATIPLVVILTHGTTHLSDCTREGIVSQYTLRLAFNALLCTIIEFVVYFRFPSSCNGACAPTWQRSPYYSMIFHCFAMKGCMLIG